MLCIAYYIYYFTLYNRCDGNTRRTRRSATVVNRGFQQWAGERSVLAYICNAAQMSNSLEYSSWITELLYSVPKNLRNEVKESIHICQIKIYWCIMLLMFAASLSALWEDFLQRVCEQVSAQRPSPEAIPRVRCLPHPPGAGRNAILQLRTPTLPRLTCCNPSCCALSKNLSIPLMSLDLLSF